MHAGIQQSCLTSEAMLGALLVAVNRDGQVVALAPQP